MLRSLLGRTPTRVQGMANLDVLSTSNILDKSAFSDTSQAHHGNNHIVRHDVGDGSSQLRSSEAVITTMLELHS
jgi:hypothetical protein